MDTKQFANKVTKRIRGLGMGTSALHDGGLLLGRPTSVAFHVFRPRWFRRKKVALVFLDGGTLPKGYIFALDLQTGEIIENIVKEVGGPKTFIHGVEVERIV